MSNTVYGFCVIAVCGLVTIFIRSLPFLIFGSRKMPDVVAYLGRNLSGAIMAILIIFCLKDVNIHSKPFGIPEFFCAALCAVIHLWKKNTILSIFVSTVLYMIITRCVI